MRIDIYLHKFGYTRSRKKAQDLIAAGGITVDGKPVKKASLEIDETVSHEVSVSEICPYVGRGGLKLEGALDAVHISPKGKIAVDVGASTGGFTDCLLKRGAVKVYAVDAGSDQLAEELRRDARVVSMERFNARDLSPSSLSELCDLAVMDVSFISQTYILPGVASVLKPGGQFISLIKPQFEAGKSAIGKNGIVHSGAYRFLAVKRVLHTAEGLGLACIGLMRSPIKGGDGNVEYLAAFEKKVGEIVSPSVTDTMIQRLTAVD